MPVIVVKSNADKEGSNSEMEKGERSLGVELC